MNYNDFYLSENATINFLLHEHRKLSPNKVAFTFLEKGEDVTATITYEQLYDQSGEVARTLVDKGIYKGDRALLLFPSCIEYIVAFLGCLRAGVIAVPLFPPQSQKNSQARMETVSLNCDASAILTVSNTYDSMQSWLETSEVLKDLPCLFPDKLEQHHSSDWQDSRITPETIAFLQYTSGSTSAPKGVVVTHRNLVHNEECLRQAMQHNENSVIASWLPIFHDMGLIGNILQSIYLGAHCVFMPPIAFVQKPIRWLKVLSEYQCQSSMAPNFAYDLCCERISEEEKRTLDLSHWLSALNGSEAVRYETLERFASYFSDCGFQYKSLYPGYGLAEATLMVASPRAEENYHYLSVSARDLANNKIVKTQPGQRGSVYQAASGRPWCKTDIVIVNPVSLERCASDEVGEIWIHSVSVARAYWNNTPATEETFYAQIYEDTDRRFFMRTGDLGFLCDGNLYITGRYKELVLIRGQNYYPQDVERSIQNSNSNFVINGGAAFSIEKDGEEKLVVVQEIKRTALRKLDIESVVADAYRAVSIEHELKLHCLCLIKPARVSKTSSGKIQRRAMKTRFLSDELEPITSHYYESEGFASVCIRPFDFKLLDKKPHDDAIIQVCDYLINLIASVIHGDVAILQSNSQLAELGMDSMAMVNLQHLIVENFGLTDNGFDVVIDANMSIFGLSENIHSLHIKKIDVIDLEEEFLAYRKAHVQSYPVSYNQESLWLVQNLHPETYVYNVVAPIEIHNDLQVEKLRRSLNALIENEDVFKSLYIQNKNGINGVPAKTLPHLDSIDCRNWRDEDINEIVDRFWKRPFRLAEEVPARFLLIRKERSQLFIPVMHHIITDMWSMLVFIEKLFGVYQNTRIFGKSKYPYARFTFEQSRYMQLNTASDDYAFWTKELEGYKTLQLPNTIANDVRRPFSGNAVSFNLDVAKSKKIKSFSKALGITPYICCLSALNILLYKLSGQSDFVVGTATAGRNSAAYKDTLGYFVNPLPLRTSINQEMKTEEYILETKKRVAACLSHQALPYQNIVNIASSIKRTNEALFPVMFAYQSLPRLKQAYPLVIANRRVDFSLGDFAVSSIPINKDYAQFDITLTLVESDIGFDGLFEFNDSVFEENAIQQLCDNFLETLSQIIENPSLQISKLNGDTVAQQAVATEPFIAITTALDEYARKTPNALAIKDSTSAYSYREFADKVNQLSHWLLHQNYSREAVVAVHMERGCDYAIAMQAIIKVGLTYFPLDTGLPPERLEYMITDAQPALIFNDKSSSEAIQEVVKNLQGSNNYHIVNPQSLKLESEISRAPEVVISADQLAYIIYTSGSTGTPKGVQCTHQGLRNCIEQCARFFEIDAHHRMLQSASYSFDASVWNTFLALHAGASLIIPNRYQLIPGPDLVNLMNSEDINYCFLSPTLMAEIDPKSVPGLRKIVAGGEELLAKIAHKWFSENRDVFNAYGPTETSICATVSKCSSNRWEPHIGKPIDNVTLVLLDESLQEVSQGQEGEIYIAGVSLARGYINSQEKNEELFVELLVSDSKPVRFYKTGDRAVLDRQGNLHYKGRKDGMVKIAGHRIELDEIRNVIIHQFDQIKNVIVVVSDNKLQCFYVTDGEEIGSSAFRQKLQLKLPSYMIPLDFVLLDNLPQTTSGKVDQKALQRLLPGTRNKTSSDKSLPVSKNELANIIHECWRSVLGHDSFSDDDLFFEVGGTSIIMARLHYLLQERLTATITMIDLYQYTSINALLEHLYSQNTNQSETSGNGKNSSRAEKRKYARKRQQTEQS